MLNLITPVRFAVKKKKQQAIKNVLLKKYGYLTWIPQFHKAPDKAPQPSDYPVWVCWWQGAEHMPELVKACYQSLLQHANGHPVHLITKENYAYYVSIPSYIIEKVENGTISITHLSDIIRVCLIYEYGGLWIDSTILVTQPLPVITTPFFSIKHHVKRQYVSESHFTGFLLYGEKNSSLFAFVKAFFFAYCEREDTFIHYLLLDYIISIGYAFIPAITKMIDEVPYNNLDHNTLRSLLKKNKPYTPSFFREVQDTCFHKLTWKRKYDKYTRKNELTFYGYLVDKERLIQPSEAAKQHVSPGIPA